MDQIYCKRFDPTNQLQCMTTRLFGNIFTKVAHKKPCTRKRTKQNQKEPKRIRKNQKEPKRTHTNQRESKRPKKYQKDPKRTKITIRNKKGEKLSKLAS